MSERKRNSTRKRWGDVQSPLILFGNEDGVSMNDPSAQPLTPKPQNKPIQKKKIRSTQEFQQLDSNTEFGDSKLLRKSAIKMARKRAVFDYLPDIVISGQKLAATSSLKKHKPHSQTKKKVRKSKLSIKNKENNSEQTYLHETGENSDSSVEFKEKLVESTPVENSTDNHTDKTASNKKSSSLLLGLNKRASDSDSVEFRFKDNQVQSAEKSGRKKVIQRQRSFDDLYSPSESKKPLQRKSKSTESFNFAAGEFVDEGGTCQPDKHGDTYNSFELNNVSNITNMNYSPPNISDEENSSDKKSDGTFEISPQKSFLRQSCGENLNNQSTFDVSPSKSTLNGTKFNSSEVTDKTKTPPSSGGAKNRNTWSVERKSNNRATFDISPEKEHIRFDLSGFGPIKHNRMTFAVSPRESVNSIDLSNIGDIKTKTPKKSIRTTEKGTPAFTLRTSQMSTPHPKKSILKQRTPIADVSQDSVFSPDKSICGIREGKEVAFEELPSRTVVTNSDRPVKSILRTTDGFARNTSKKSFRLRESIVIIEDDSPVSQREDSEVELPQKESATNGELQKVKLTFDDGDAEEDSMVQQPKNQVSLALGPINKSKGSLSCGTPHPKSGVKDAVKAIKLNGSINKSDLGSNSKSIRTKVPNFALIHQRAYERMENIKEMQERKQNRAQLLLSGHKPDKESVIFKNEDTKSKKALHFGVENDKSHNIFNLNTSKGNTSLKNKIRASLEKKKIALKSRIPKKAAIELRKEPPKCEPVQPRVETAKFGLRKCAVVTKQDKEDHIKSVMEKSKVRKEVKDVKRTEVKGVRLNKRFELLMQMRNKKK